MVTNKKHIDFNRIMWTILIPVIIVALTYGVYLLGNIVGRKWLVNFDTSGGWWVLPLIKIISTWTIGAFTIASPFILGSLIWGLTKIVNFLLKLLKNTCKLIIRFYYHNGDENVH